jgi:hypothetical protein
MVFSIGVVSFTGFTGSKVDTTVSIIDTIIVVVGWNGVRVGRLSTISWSWSINWGRSINWCWGIDRSRSILRSS